MYSPLQLVSGIPWRTSGEVRLVESLGNQSIKLDLSRLVDYKSTAQDSATCTVVVLILPIFGDNDLTDEIFTYLTRLVLCKNYRKRTTIVVAHGDRHASDELIARNTPFSIKIHSLFSGVSSFELLTTKLDQFTADTLACEILDFLKATNSRDNIELNRITNNLSRAPKWCVRKRLLDFYDYSTGSSLLKPLNRVTQTEVAGHIFALAPRILKTTHAGLNDNALAVLEAALYSEVIDLGSNHFSWETIVPHIAACRWLCLAANGLSLANLSQIPQELKHLYLHKNDINEFIVEPAEVARLQTLSIYRNKVAAFDWPAAQSELTRLNVGANPILSLPETLSECIELEFLGIARTQLSSLPEWIFSLPKLQELDISYIEERVPPSQITHLRAKGISLITRPGLFIP